MFVLTSLCRANPSRTRAVITAFLAVVLCALPGSAAAQETVEYYATDAIGSVRVVFDGAGNVTGRMDYEPFGRELYQGLFMPSERFAQLTREAEAGQEYAQARRYQSHTGRFTATDPVYAGLFTPQKWNRYTYGGNNPIRFVDPGGKDLLDLGAWLNSVGVVVYTQHKSDAVFTQTSNPAFSGPTVSVHDDIFNTEVPTLGGWGTYIGDEELPGNTSGDSSGSWLDTVQTTLDVASITLDLTGIGATVSWVPDVVNATVSAVRGDWPGAMMSAGAMIPFAGGAGNLARITFGHGARHLVKTGLQAADVEALILREIQDLLRTSTIAGEFRSRMSVGGVLIEYRAFVLDNGTINVGTYYTVR